MRKSTRSTLIAVVTQALDDCAIVQTKAATKKDALGHRRMALEDKGAMGTIMPAAALNRLRAPFGEAWPEDRYDAPRRHP